MTSEYPKDACRKVIVVAGTGTGVGKTYVSGEILSTLRMQGVRCLGLKPAETGFVDPASSDAEHLADRARHARIQPHFVSVVPQSPHRVARAAGVTLTARDLASWVHAHVEAHDPEVTLVETAGGLCTPLNDTETNLELVAALEPCVFVLVAADRLGALHDVVCAVRAASASFRPPDIVCLNSVEGWDATLDNPNELRRILTKSTVVEGPVSFRGSSWEPAFRLFISGRK